jgi:16S rRNA U516 pseudouridylate synthase RsuA-like enzyme
MRKVDGKKAEERQFQRLVSYMNDCLLMSVLRLTHSLKAPTQQVWRNLARGDRDASGLLIITNHN